MMSSKFLRKLRKKLFRIVCKKANAKVEELTITVAEYAKKLESIDESGRLGSLEQQLLLLQKKQNITNGIRVAFIFQQVSIWTAWKSVIEAFSNDERVIVDIVLAPFVHANTSAAIAYDDARNFLLENDIPYFTSNYYDLNQFMPDVVFIQNPYDETRPKYLQLNEFLSRSIKVAYIPYGLELGGGKWNVESQFNLSIQQTAWRIFARSERHKKMYSRYCESGSSHVCVTGHPKFDNYINQPVIDIDKALAKKVNGRKVLLWTPHFAVGDPPTWSTYRIYCDAILERISKTTELFLLIRPHPLFFHTMRYNNIWNSQDEDEFRRKIKEADNIALDENVDPAQSFSLASALMTDVGSFLLEFLPTEKPILYLHHPEGLGMNQDGNDLVDYLYSASSTSEVEEFIDMINAGEDPSKNLRKMAVEKFLFGVDGLAGKRICDHVIATLLKGDDSSPRRIHYQYNDFQVKSENFWVKTENTYLAPKDYYDKREEILEEELTVLPGVKNVIDIGCGDGRFTRQLAKFANNVDAYDISSILITRAIEKVSELQIDNVVFHTAELDEIKPFSKYNLVSCMGVTSCLIDDVKFIRILDSFKDLVMPEGHLLLIDTLSTSADQMATDDSGYIAKYRDIKSYCQLIERRGFNLIREVVIKDIPERKLVNKLFIFSEN